MEILGFIGGIIALIIIVKLLLCPIKLFFKLLINAAVGLVILFIFNHFGMMLVGFVIPINFITAAIVGILGIPGILGLIVYFMFF